MFNIRTFDSLKNPVFRLFYGGMLGQMAAMNMQLVVRSLLIYRLSGSAAILGLMALANAVPMVSLSLFGGVVADRVQKKYVLLTGQSCSAVVSLIVAITLTTGYLSAERAGSWWILIVTATLQGIIMGIMMPSRQAIIAEIVEPNLLLNAVSLNTLGMNSLRFLTPAIGGLIVDYSGFDTVYYTTTVMYIVAVIFIAKMPVTGTVRIGPNNTLKDIKDGLRYIRHEPNILLILLFALVVVVFSRPYQFLLPIFTDDVLKVGATGLGILMSVSGVGAIFASTILATMPNRKRGLLFLLSGLILSLALIGFAFSQTWIISLALITFVGVGDTGRMTLANTLVQYYVDNQYRGRVMSILIMEFGLMSFGVFFAGLLADVIGVQWSVGGLAAVLTFLSITMLCFSRRLRTLD
ncbi:MAG: MFS transporter [Deltaproteobacteria bacterium]|nr:MFS transporter [Deltaproteobacteria bacterium]